MRRQAAERLTVRCQQLLEEPERFRYDTTKVARLARQYRGAPAGLAGHCPVTAAAL
jgi:hypothetical protein